MTKIGTIRPLLFDNNLIIALTNDWLGQFTKVPEFEVIVNNKKRLCIVSTEAIKR